MEKQLTASNKEINRIMALNKMFTRRGAVAVAAGTALVFGTAACSEAEDAKDNTTSAAQDATDAAGDDGNKATDAAGSAANDATEAAGDASQDVKDLPEDIKAAWENTGGANGELGDFEKFEKGDKGALATFAKGQIASSDETGPVKLIGKIGEVWTEGGALDNELGLPTAAETGDAASGWTQTFQNGTITWAQDEAGTFKETIEKQ